MISVKTGPEHSSPRSTRNAFSTDAAVCEIDHQVVEIVLPDLTPDLSGTRFRPAAIPVIRRPEGEVVF